MLKELLSHRPIQVALLLVILIGISGIFYLNHVKTQTEGDAANPKTGAGTQVTPPANIADTPNPSTQGGHRHADGTWHAELHQTEPERRDATESETVSAIPVEKQAVPPGQPTSPSETDSPVKLDPEIQARVDALFNEASALSTEADAWSAKLYAESQELLKEIAANKAENAKRRKMRHDPNVDKETFETLDAALDAKVRATGAEAVRINELHQQNWERRDEAMRLRAEARRLQGRE